MLMIRSFKDKDTENFYNRQQVNRFSGLERTALKRLRILDSAPTLETLTRLPGNRLESFENDNGEQYNAIRINEQWYVCFRWIEGAEDVEIANYHQRGR